jgi:hypothetical protein
MRKGFVWTEVGCAGKVAAGNRKTSSGNSRNYIISDQTCGWVGIESARTVEMSCGDPGKSVALGSREGRQFTEEAEVRERWQKQAGTGWRRLVSSRNAWKWIALFEKGVYESHKNSAKELTFNGTISECFSGRSIAKEGLDPPSRRRLTRYQESTNIWDISIIACASHRTELVIPFILMLHNFSGICGYGRLCHMWRRHGNACCAFMMACQKKWVCQKSGVFLGPIGLECSRGARNPLRVGQKDYRMSPCRTVRCAKQTPWSPVRNEAPARRRSMSGWSPSAPYEELPWSRLKRLFGDVSILILNQERGFLEKWD